ncbi:hypothetical protein [Bacillus cereus group sp. BfR-BA-01380]|uniref:hypothetical protein n=1 Tax=Bacillus cereus group sp. BfR-BA-01380 TaxID=2920324 RepID=UPI001F570A2B|nr:hypothetical protein [Bacillus cereus group sp. BfR-BA-01380]
MYILTFLVDLCIIINAITFLICAFFIYLLPNADENIGGLREPIHLKTIIADLKIVMAFAQKTKYFIIVYLLFQGAILIGYALDTQEVTYIKQILKLTDRDYGLIVSITGIGALVGAFVAAVCSKKTHLKLYIGGGMLLTSIGYIFFIHPLILSPQLFHLPSWVSLWHLQIQGIQLFFKIMFQ